MSNKMFILKCKGCKRLLTSIPASHQDAGNDIATWIEKGLEDCISLVEKKEAYLLPSGCLCSTIMKKVHEYNKMQSFAKKLALALADEVAFHGDENSAERSLRLLSDARDYLDLADRFDEIDSLKES